MGHDVALDLGNVVGEAVGLGDEPLVVSVGLGVSRSALLDALGGRNLSGAGA